MELKYLWLALELCSFLTLPSVIIKKSGRPSATIAWSTFLVIFPPAGLFFWWLIGHDHLHRKLKRYKRLKSEYKANEGVYPITDNNSFSFLATASEFNTELLNQIKHSKKYIHLCFYIWQPGELSTQIVRELVAKRDEGVEVRVLIDSLGSFGLSQKVFGELVNKGGKVSRFLPINFFGRNPRLNFRNHRKLAIFDGKRAITGGINIGERYQNWADCATLIQGSSVEDLQEVFANDWLFSTQEDLFRSFYQSDPKEFTGHDSCQVIASGPDIKHHNLYDTLIMAIQNAEKSWTICTPYLVLDDGMKTIIRVAKNKGLKVEIFIPKKSDHLLLDIVNRANLNFLTHLGVNIYQTEQFLHAKLHVFDRKTVLLGSSNFDQRSFRLNFETSCLVSSQTISREIDEFLSLLSKNATTHEWKKRNKFKKLIDALAQLFSPLL